MRKNNVVDIEMLRPTNQLLNINEKCSKNIEIFHDSFLMYISKREREEKISLSKNHSCV